jgi:hypothetical protein
MCHWSAVREVCGTIPSIPILIPQKLGEMPMFKSYEEKFKASLASMDSVEFSNYRPIGEIDTRCYHFELQRRQDPDWKPSPNPPRRANTPGRMIFGACLFLFALIGGTNNITKILPSAAVINILIALPFLIAGLVLMLKPPKSRTIPETKEAPK